MADMVMLPKAKIPNTKKILTFRLRVLMQFLCFMFGVFIFHFTDLPRLSEHGLEDPLEEIQVIRLLCSILVMSFQRDKVDGFV